MPRPSLWSSIAEALESEIAGGLYPPGARLPTESELSARFGVNRHTVRHALASLAEAGTVYARRGAGVFVAARPTTYPLGRRVRFHDAMAAAGRVPSRRYTRRETRPSDADEAGHLKLAPGTPVHVIEGLSLADGQPLAAFCSVLPAARFPDLFDALGEAGSLTAAFRACGLVDYTRAETCLTATLAPATLALALQIPQGAPVLRSVAINVDAEGRPVEFGTTWFAGERVTLTVAPESAVSPG